MEAITESTAVSIGLLIVIIGSVWGTTKWMSSIHAMAKENVKTLERHQTKIAEVEKDLALMGTKHEEIGSRLTKIETILEFIKEHLTKKVGL